MQRGQIIEAKLVSRTGRIVERQGNAGFALSMVKGADMAESECQWEKQIECWGKRNTKGDPFEEDVSRR